MASTAGTTAAIQNAVIAQAIRASGAIVRVTQEEFMKILRKVESPLIIAGISGVFKKKYEYLTSHRGFIFFTLCDAEIAFPSHTEIIAAKKIWIP